MAKVSASVAADVSVASFVRGVGGFSGTFVSVLAAVFGFFGFFGASVAKGRKNGLSGGGFVAFFALLVSVRCGRGLVPMGQNFTRESAQCKPYRLYSCKLTIFKVPVRVVQVGKIVRITNVLRREVRLETAGKVDDLAMLIFLHRLDQRQNPLEQFALTHP